MKKETLNKLRRYIDLTARLSLPTGNALPALREKVWKEFVEAAEAEAWAVEELSDEAITLHHAVMDLME